ncbi:uncharacterized protein LOC107482199 [Arachis duranensis]|uniref:Uncharacterized protein LOC107482199 n=1 Tax=Arachis duranensis TaxID=130453 RepID=A0A6P4D279_ARADU|nr:uncharacterized protein LOC107482199 [Arachis duranensis]
MPSASKRRRAAAKKKKAQDNAIINSPPLGNGELKSQDIQNGDSPTHHENARQPASDAESMKQESSNVNNDQVKEGNEEEEACAIVIESDSQSNESSEAENISSEEPKTNEYDNEEHSDDSKNPACSENQPLVASIQMIQKTSWWSCCGLFEVLRASDR